MPVFTRDGNAILFVHVPRTGGSSISAFLTQTGWQAHDTDSGSVFRRENANYYRRVSPQHWHAQLLAQLYKLERFSQIIQFVRNPVERAISEYRWRRFAPAGSARRIDLEFADWWQASRSAYRESSCVGDNHFRPQADFLLPTALIGYFERDLNDVFFQNAGLAGPDPSQKRPMPRLNPSIITDAPLDPALRKQVENFYARDYDLFGYPREIDATPH